MFSVCNLIDLNPCRWAAKGEDKDDRMVRRAWPRRDATGDRVFALPAASH
eukprot:SAG31_NODE_43569_length_266_cov_0.946108_1_plen_49_part_01